MRLNMGDPFPELSGNTILGATIRLPQDIKTDWAVVIGYRAHW